jgi:glycosyltransferase involved in cell wall biosynthesis
MSKVRVVHLSVVHTPDDPRIYERECRALSQAGYQVAYLAPGAERRRDDWGVLVAPLPKRSRKTRFLNTIEIAQALRAMKPHVLHVHDPELLTLFPGVKAFVPRLVYDMHEYLPEQVAAKPYIPEQVRPVAAQATGVAQKGLAALADGVVVVVQDQLDALGDTPRQRLVLPNYPRVERFEGAEPLPELAADPRLKLIYVGSLSRNRGCSLMLDVMEQLEPDEAVLYLGGVFAAEDLAAEVKARLTAGLGDRVKLLGRVPPPELPRYLAAADVAWVPSLESTQYAHPTVPTKLLEGMAMGLPALVSNLPGRGELVRLEQCGLAVPPGVHGHLAGVRRLLANRGALDEMGRRGRGAVERSYSWEAVEGDLVEFYGSLTDGLR